MNKHRSSFQWIDLDPQGGTPKVASIRRGSVFLRSVAAGLLAFALVGCGGGSGGGGSAGAPAGPTGVDRGVAALTASTALTMNITGVSINSPPVVTFTVTDQTGVRTAILAAAVLRRMGHTVALFVTENHAALAVSAPPGIVQGHYMAVDGLRFYYCETSSAGWVVGELPPGVDPTALRLSLLTPDETPERAAA